MTNNENMVFDANCGISEEEQKEILAHINGITEKNRQSLAGATDASAQAAGSPGQKSGGKNKKGAKWFSKPDFKAKNSGILFPIAVNAAAVLALIGGLIALYAFQGKTSVQVREGSKVYNSAERALIEEMRREMASHDGAFNEMEQLSREQSQAATVEAQMGAFFATLNSAIDENRIEDAAAIIQSMKGFLSTPAFQTLRSIQARKDLYTQAINSAETMIDALSSGQLSLDTGSQQLLADLQEKNAQLERNVEVLSSGAGGMAQEIKTLQDSNDALRTMNTTLETSVNAKDGQINALETQNSRLEQTADARQNTITRVQDIVRGKDFENLTFNEIRESLERIYEVLGL